MTQIFTIANQKGGVGKSTFATHQAFYYARKGQAVLCIDMDGQGNSTKTLSSRAEIACDAIKLFRNDALPVIPAEPGAITLIRGTTELNEVERFANTVVELPRTRLQSALDAFDCCIIDTPPTLGLRLIAALLLSDFVICPIDLGSYSTDGVSEMIGLIQKIQGNDKLNPNLQFLGMVPNRVNPRASKHKEAIKTMYRDFADYIIQQPLVERISVQNATDSGRPVWEHKTGSAQVAGKEWRAALDQVNHRAREVTG